jgi:hypothetical protein
VATRRNKLCSQNKCENGEKKTGGTGIDKEVDHIVFVNAAEEFKELHLREKKTGRGRKRPDEKSRKQ